MTVQRRLIGNVLVHVDGLPVHYGPDGAVPPPDVAELIGDHLWEDVTSGDEVADPDLGDAGEDDGGDDDETGEAVLPKKGGPGSGLSKWVAYAAAHNVPVADGASKDDIIAALTAAGVPTE